MFLDKRIMNSYKMFKISVALLPIGSSAIFVTVINKKSTVEIPLNLASIDFFPTIRKFSFTVFSGIMMVLRCPELSCVNVSDTATVHGAFRFEYL